MRVLVCGSRKQPDLDIIWETLDALAKAENIDCIIEGDAPGADRVAGHWAKRRKVDLYCYPADWDKYDKSAGFIRNKQMLDEGKPDLVLAFWDGKSPGTKNMIEQAEKAGVEVKVIRI